MHVTQQQAQAIVAQYEGDDTVIEQFNEICNEGFSYTSSIKFYAIDIVLRNVSYLLAAIPKTFDSKSDLVMQPLPLGTIRDLLLNISDNTSLPVPELRGFDDSLACYPFHYLFLRLPSHNAQSLSSLRSSGALTPRQDALLDLKLGTVLHSLHSIQNDWFGVPGTQPDEDVCYSWQDTFMLLLDGLLCELESTGEIQGTLVEDIRKYLSRAIGSFLFEDAEVPTLVWSTGSADDIYVQVSQPCGPNEEATVDIAYVMPTFDRVVWGDPMLEAFFMPPGPSKALEEGYLEGEGGTLIIFPRQRTKRMWYTLFLALVVLAEVGRDKEKGEADNGMHQKLCWARDVLPRCVESLKDAPCY
ncbi:uncharacterized protein EDB91DRAFT_627085 [Suillus paluster]|uniref:uncharacterized protein n=1 Tax=Suillus paluster TaxID=48578 RepID=UPI001B87E64F|nr:uncharacterized protein EDB91DRAFT_627085 [Suillus paluster]KAG1733897.1 hypothetical protein EDB91DRAFT_627085 [Suillus paluster]